MDETSVFFDMAPEKSLVRRGIKSVTIRTSGAEKRHVTVVLTVTADGSILRPMVMFRGKTNHPVKDLVAPKGFLVATQKKS